MKKPKGAVKQAGSLATLAMYMLVLFSGLFSLPVEAAVPKEIGHGKPASASDYRNDNEAPSYVNDGIINEEYRWYTGSKAGGHWVQIDLEDVYSISQVTIHWGTGDTHSPDYDILISNDGENFTPVLSNAAGGKGLADSRYFPQAVEGRFVRILMNVAGDWGTGVQELLIYGVPIAAAGEVAQGKPVNTNAEKEGNEASKINDGEISSDSRWYDAANVNGVWVAIDLENLYRIDEVVVYWDKNDVTAQEYEIQVSQDGEEYQTVSDRIGKDGEDFTIDSHSVDTVARFVRLFVLEKGPWGSSVQEMEVYGVPYVDDSDEAIAQRLEAETSTFLQGVNGSGVVAFAVPAASGGQVVRGFSDSGDGAGIEFHPLLTDVPVSYRAVLGYAKELYEYDDSISLYVNNEKVGQYNLLSETSDVTRTIVSSPIRIDLKSGDTLSVKLDMAAGDKGDIRIDYLELTPVRADDPDPDSSTYKFEYGRLRMQVGETAALTLSRGNIGDVDLTVSDPNIVSLDGNVARALADGQVVVTATSKTDPEDFATCTIVVGDSALVVVDLEAEEGTLVDGKGATDPEHSFGQGNLVVKSSSAASGGKDVDGFVNSGDGAGVQFKMPDDFEEMEYQLSVRYARDKYYRESDSISVWVNGRNQGSYKTPPRSSFSDYGFAGEPVVVRLKAGDTLKVGVNYENGDLGLYRVDLIQLVENASITVQDITLPEDFTMLRREKQRLDYGVFPESANTELLWESSDPSVLIVDEGIVTALSVGQATVTATSAINAEISKSMTITVAENDQLATIASDELEVLVSQAFPRVFEYKFIDNGATMQGAGYTNDTMVVNGTEYQPEVTFRRVNTSTVQYDLAIAELDAVITVQLMAEDNLFKLDVTNIKESGLPSQRIFTFGFPDHNIVSVSSREAGAAFAGSQMATALMATGDTFTNLEFSSEEDYSNATYLYAFLNNENMAVGIRSNAQDSRILKRTIKEGSAYVTSLWSGVWRYRADDYTKTFQDIDGRYGKAGAIVTNTYQAEFTEDMPLLYLAFAQDINNSGDVDWQDAGIAFRDIMETAIGMDYIPDAVVQRLVFPQSGEGNYPYIASLDETKRVYLATDGLGQLVINKYHNEGVWGDFTVFDERLGGIDDFNHYVSESVQNYNAWQGVHTNFTEIYTSAGGFRPERITMLEDGVTPMSPGFTGYSYWLQQVYEPDVTFDAISLERMDRLVEFAENVPDLGFVYSDVFSRSGWNGRRLAEDYAAAGLSYFVEWPYQNEAEAVWSHWAVEKMYGSVTLAAYSSDIARFVFNHTKDRWDNYSDNDRLPNASNLLMGADTTLYEGWPNRDTNNSFNQAMRVVFDNNLPSKYMQHFPILRMEKDMAGWATHIWFEDGVEVFRDEANGGKRTITKDGKVLYNEDSYLIPWNEGEFGGSETEEKEVKLYHWNEKGGTTSWELPNSWDGLTQVYMYELTDLGRTNRTVLTVSGGSVTLENIKAKTAYVIHKTDVGVEVEEVAYGDGSYIADPGFNYGDLRAWKVEKGNPEVKKNDTEFDDPNTPGWGRNAPYGEQRNYELIIDGTDETAISQEITGLEPGEYAASVMVEIQQGKQRKASIIVETGGETYTNYSDKSILYNYDEYDSKLGTYMLRMRVTFVVPEGESTAKLTLHAEEGDGKVRFDNARIYATTTPEAPEGSRHVLLYQDFEYAVKEGAAGSEENLNRYKPTYEGYFPFNIGASRGIHETRISIQTANPPYTENGKVMWDPATVPIDDVLEGKKALKILGTDVGIAVQTSPQTVRFEAGKTYRVSFLYQTQPADDYAFVIGDGAASSHNNTNHIVESHTLQATSDSILFSTEFTATSDQFWFGINRTKMTYSTSDNPSPIVLDNILVEEVRSSYDTSELEELVQSAKGKVEQDYTTQSWAAFKAALTTAEAVLEKASPSEQEIFDAYTGLYDAMRALKYVRVDVIDVSLSESALTLRVGETQQLTATVYPADATNKAVEWASSDSDVVYVDVDGGITALAAGTATITVTTKDGGYKASCTITVVEPTDLAFTEKPSVSEFKVGESFTLATNYEGGTWQHDPDFLSAGTASRAAGSTASFTTLKTGITTVRYTLGSVTIEFELRILDDQTIVETQTYSLSYDINWGRGGNGGIKDSTKYKFGDTVTVTSTTPQREGYTFIGWNTQKDGNGLSYKAGSTFQIGADMTLYAQWTAVPTGDGDGSGSGGVWQTIVAATGDSAATTVFIVVAAVALLTGAILVIYRIRKRKSNS